MDHLYVFYFLVERICCIDCGCDKIFSLLIIYLGFGTVQEAASGFFGCNRCGCPCKSQLDVYLFFTHFEFEYCIIISTPPFDPVLVAQGEHTIIKSISFGYWNLDIDLTLLHVTLFIGPWHYWCSNSYQPCMSTRSY